MIESPIVCEGKQIDTITYSLSHGSFGVIQPKENPCVLEGTECDTDEGKYCDFNIEPKGASKVKLMKKSYSSFTISAKDQQKVVIYLRDNKKCQASYIIKYGIRMGMMKKFRCENSGHE